MKQRTETCLACHGTGKVVPGFQQSRAGVRAGSLITDVMKWISENRDDRTRDSVDIPRKHARDAFMITSIVFGAASWLTGADTPRAAAWALLLSTLSAGAVRALASVGDWNLLLWRVEQLAKIDLTGDGVIGEPVSQQPRQTAIDEIDTRFPNGAPKTASLTWLPISPEETQKLAVALVVDDVLFAREDLKRVNAIRHNDYTAVKNALLSRGFLRKVGNGMGVTMAGYRWFCKKIPGDVDPLPYTSLRIGRL